MLRRFFFLLFAHLAFWAGGSLAASPAISLSAMESMLQDGLYSSVWEFASRKILSATNAAERAEAVLLASRAALGMDKPADALDLMAASDKDISSNGFATQAQFWKSRLLLAAKRPAEASQALANIDLLPDNDPYRIPMLRLKALALLELGKEEEALFFFGLASQASGADEDSAESRLDRAALLLRLNRPAEAEPILADLSTSGWSTLAASRARIWLGRIRNARGNFEAGRLEVEPVATSTNAPARVRARAYEVLSDSLEGMGKLTNAVVSLEQAEKFLDDPAELARIRLDRARVLILLGQVEEGARLLRSHIAAAGLPEGAAQSQALIAAAYAAAGRHEEAVKAWQEYLEAFDDPKGLAAAHYGKGSSLVQIGHYAEAAVAFAKAADAADLPEQKRDALLAQAESLLASGSPGRAREVYGNLLSADTGLEAETVARARFQAAQCLAQDGQAEAADTEWEALAHDFPTSPWGQRAMNEVALFRERKGAWEEAIQIYQKISDSAKDAHARDAARLRIGILNYRRGDYDRALAAFDSALSDTSNTGDQATYFKIWTLHMMGQREEALIQAKTFMAAHPRSEWADDVLFWMGEVRFNQGDYESAESLFVRLMREYPDTPVAADAMFWAGRSATMQKQYLRAMEFFSRYVTRYPNAQQVVDALFHEADALTALGRFPEAILVFDEIIKNYPRSPLVYAAWGRKGDCCFTLGATDTGRYAEAARVYQFLMDSRDTPADIRWQAEYKLAQTLERQGQVDLALQHLLAVVYGVSAEGGRMPPGVSVWFARAALDAGTRLEQRNRLPEATAVYRRLAAAELAASEEASARIRKLQSTKAPAMRANGS